MKLKILLKLVEKLLGTSDDERTSADMYLSDRILGMGIIFLAGGSGAALSVLFTHRWVMLALGLLGIVAGIVAIMCWKNQKVQMISETEFEHTTFLGNTYRYKFTEITGLRKNNDSLTLYIGQRKVHIESNALLSDRFANAINQALKNL